MSENDPKQTLSTASNNGEPDYSKPVPGPFDYILSLRVRHPTAADADVTRLVDLDPVRSWSAGESRTTPTGEALGGTREATYCAFDMGRGSDGELARCVAKAVETLEARRAGLDQLRASGGSLSLFVSWHADGDTGQTFTSALLGDLATLGVDFELNVLAG